jgi:hypothetical protein
MKNGGSYGSQISTSKAVNSNTGRVVQQLSGPPWGARARLKRKMRIDLTEKMASRSHLTPAFAVERAFRLPITLFSVMKNLFPSFAKAAAVALCALTFGSCNRAEYAMLPKGASYHGVTRAATPVPAAKPTTVATAETTPVAQPATEEAATAPVTAEAATAATNVPAAPAKAAAPQATAPKATEVAAAPAAAAIIASDAPQAKGLTKMLTRKIEKRVAKLMNKVPSADRQNTAETAKGGFSVSLKTGIILMVVGALIALLPGLFRLLGLIIFIVGVLILLLALLDMA